MSHTERTRPAWLACLVLAAACGTPRDAQQSASPFAPAPDPHEGPPQEVIAARKPWTTAFLKPGLLVAAEVRIEGPVGLLDHVATRTDPEFHDRVEKTVPAGFLQQITLKPGVGEAEIKGQLDALAVVATKRLIVIERPGPGDVAVTARGDAYWRDDATKAEKRGATLTFAGKIEL